MRWLDSLIAHHQTLKCKWNLSTLLPTLPPHQSGNTLVCDYVCEVGFWIVRALFVPVVFSCWPRMFSSAVWIAHSFPHATSGSDRRKHLHLRSHANAHTRQQHFNTFTALFVRGQLVSRVAGALEAPQSVHAPLLTAAVIRLRALVLLCKNTHAQIRWALNVLKWKRHELGCKLNE